ncbi:hypothetical protein ACJX0J_030856, partial [Zea mays]
EILLTLMRLIGGLSLFAAQQLHETLSVLIIVAIAVEEKAQTWKGSRTAGSTNKWDISLKIQDGVWQRGLVNNSPIPSTTPISWRSYRMTQLQDLYGLYEYFVMSKEEHATHLQVFWLDQVPFLGHILSSQDYDLEANVVTDAGITHIKERMASVIE